VSGVRFGSRGSLSALGLAAIGTMFGDIDSAVPCGPAREADEAIRRCKPCLSR
jgi:hypothetical protein